VLRTLLGWRQQRDKAALVADGGINAEPEAGRRGLLLKDHGLGHRRPAALAAQRAHGLDFLGSRSVVLLIGHRHIVSFQVPTVKG